MATVMKASATERQAMTAGVNQKLERARSQYFRRDIFTSVLPGAQSTLDLSGAFHVHSLISRDALNVDKGQQAIPLVRKPAYYNTHCDNDYRQ
jgi:hypothetical protein